MVSVLASGPSCPRFVSQKKFQTKKLLRLLGVKESGQWLKNVDRTHLVLASGKLVLQKERVWSPGPAQSKHYKLDWQVKPNFWMQPFPTQRFCSFRATQFDRGKKNWPNHYNKKNRASPAPILFISPNFYFFPDFFFAKVIFWSKFESDS